MKFINLNLVFLLFFTFDSAASEVTIIDASHYSKVFGEIRNYRIFLPPNYLDQPAKNYPVIYYYHGWSQRYFGETNPEAMGVDKGMDNDGDNIENFVLSHEVIVVKPDGYNRNPQEAYYLRPYNVSPVETNRQFPLYFPELVSHIDEKYRTIADRNHRAISGLSMGGFMTFWIAGKYPHLVSAAGNFCGSTEFFVGPKNNPVEYRHIDMYKNYQGMNVRLHYGNKDFIRGYHQDLNKVWTQVMDNYNFKIFEAEHSTCGLTEMYEFILDTFQNPPLKPAKWHHTDVYPSFTVWNYQIHSDRNRPGFTVLENVDQRGFRCMVREFLPDGPLMPYVQLTVVTPPLYERNQPYTIYDVDPKSSKKDQFEIYSDHEGRLKIPLNGGYHEIGINKAVDIPNLTLAQYNFVNSRWALQNQDVEIAISLLNKGNAFAKGVTANLIPFKKSTTVKQGQIEFGTIAVNEIRKSEQTIAFQVQNDKAISVAKFKLVISDQNGREWVEHFEIPINTDPPTIKNYTIADGKNFTVAAAGDDSVSIFLGRGNGDGVANPGESIVILAKHQGIYYRTFLNSNDHFVNPNGLNLRKSDNWGSYDHVGGSAKYSVPIIASNCPDNHTVNFLTEYWLPDYPYHIIKQGKVDIKISGKDLTPPIVQWAQISGDNTLQISVRDGGEIQSVIAKLKTVKTPDKILKVTLNDHGKYGDKAKGDHVFSHKISAQKFAEYTIEIETTDAFGNTMTTNWPGKFILY